MQFLEPENGGKYKCNFVILFTTYLFFESTLYKYYVACETKTEELFLI